MARVPDFFIVGHPKCGTTALFETLSAHPQIFLPDRKEPRWFSSDLPSPYQPRSDRRPVEGWADYLALFERARADQLIGEGSTAYIFSRTAARLIAEAQPQARIIVIFREPASFLRSLHLQFLQHKTEEVENLLEAIELEDERRRGGQAKEADRDWPQVLRYGERVRYVEQLRRYHAAFPPEQVLVLIYDDFRSDNDGTVRRVERFLGVQERGAPSAADANPSVRRRVAVDNALHEAFFGGGGTLRAARRAARSVIPEQARRRAFATLREKLVFASPGDADPEVMYELRRRYAGEVRALSEYLGRDLLREWGYQDIE